MDDPNVTGPAPTADAPPPVEPPPPVNSPPPVNNPVPSGNPLQPVSPTPAPIDQEKPPTGVNVGPDGLPIDPTLDANGNPLPENVPSGQPPGVVGQPNPATPPTGSNVGPDGLPIDPTLDANGNPLPGNVPGGQGPVGPAPGTPGGPPLGPPPGLAKEKFDTFVGTNSVDDFLGLLAGESLEEIVTNISPEQAEAILAKYGSDPKFLAFIGAPVPPGGAQPPTGVNVGPDELPIDPTLDANGNPLPPGQQGGQPSGPPRKPPGLPQEKFESLRVFNGVDDLIAKLEGENLDEIGNNISDEQGAEIIAALSPEELLRLSKFIEEKTGIPLDSDPPDVVSPDLSTEPAQVIGSVPDVVGS